MQFRTTRGFTLIELSIVLVIIGLIVGGVLVGRDLIAAAAVRAQVTQIEKYQSAVNTFLGKYSGLPGDIDGASAGQFGFVARGSYAGEGDGNRVIEGVDSDAAGHNSGALVNMGETGTFWTDLTQAKLIDGAFSGITPTSGPNYVSKTTTPTFRSFMPEAKIGQGNYVYVWSGGWSLFSGSPDGANYFGISSPDVLSSTGNLYSSPGLTSRQAYMIDSKIDDGLPQAGRVLAFLPYNGTVYWAAGGGGAANGNTGQATYPAGGPDTTATSASTITCYDNGGLGGKVQSYSLSSTTNNGGNMNCTLSFKFQ